MRASRIASDWLPVTLSNSSRNRRYSERSAIRLSLDVWVGLVPGKVQAAMLSALWTLDGGIRSARAISRRPSPLALSFWT